MVNAISSVKVARFPVEEEEDVQFISFGLTSLSIINMSHYQGIYIIPQSFISHVI